ncbi:VOC family protein [Sorangium sp. So ce1078]|uniref:VOC family protein n=1 Tax=Sorangium sp. So ce1078 TaxID=3133329 RepID=UPI003F605433
MIIHHTGIGVSDVARSAAFYDAVLGALGYRRVMQLPDDTGADAVGYGADYPAFWIDRFHPHGTRNHTAFRLFSCANGSFAASRLWADPWRARVRTWLDLPSNDPRCRSDFSS